MAAILYAADQGLLDDIPLIKIAQFEKGLLDYAHAHHADFMNKLTQSGDYNDEIVKTLRSMVESFKKTQSWD